MSEQEQAPRQSTGMSRKNFLAGTVGAGAGGLIVGGAAGYAIGEFHGDYFFARDPDGRYVGFHANEEHGHGHDHDH